MRIALTGRSFEEMLQQTKKGTTEEKLAAINKIFESSDVDFIYHLSPLNKLYLSLDKKGETKEYLNHLVALAYAKAEDYFLEDEYEKACEEFAKIAKNKYITTTDKQMALFTAGRLLAESGSKEFIKIQDYLKQAYDLDAESEIAGEIKAALDRVQMILDGEGDELPPQSEGESETSQN